MIRQRTLKKPVRTTGVGLHSGQKVHLIMSPAPVNSGIVFQREVSGQIISIPATAQQVVSTELATTLGDEAGNTISTIEHLMAAFAGLGVDNCVVRVSASEVPIMDGSSAPFVYLLQAAGLQEQPALRRYIRITKPVVVQDGEKWLRFAPYSGSRVAFGIDFKHPAISEGSQQAEIDISTTKFINQLCRARTFGFMGEIEQLRKRNLALGGSLDNAIVVDDYKVLNSGGLRFGDEFVRHKMLDAIGDMYQLGCGFIGSLSGYKSGHGLNNQLALELLARTSAWEEVTLGETVCQNGAKAKVFSPVLQPSMG